MAFTMAEGYDGELCRRSPMAQREGAIGLVLSRYYSTVIYTIFILCVCSFNFQKMVLHEKSEVQVPLKIDVSHCQWSMNYRLIKRPCHSLAFNPSELGGAEKGWWVTR